MNEYTSKKAAEKLGITHNNFRQIVYKLKIKPEKKIGNYPIYTDKQLDKIQQTRK
jgi:DNA-binding transcriptional MerR regulator